MRLADIPHDKILLVRWRDIIEFHSREQAEIQDEDDYERVVPIVESLGRIVGVRRGMIALEPEWHIMKDHKEYEGHAGETVQLMPVGCIEAVYEMKIGKKIYKNPLFEDEVKEGHGTPTASASTQ